MTRKLFGTDGVRGTANSHPMTAEMALRLGQAAGKYFRNGGQRRHSAVIGKDTRLSGYMIENALTAGLLSSGMHVLLLGPAPTPATGLLTRSMRADLGIMISASHNPHEDNGIKFFGPDGYKLSDEAEDAIEALLDGPIEPVPPRDIGRAKRIEGDRARYVEYVKTTFPQRSRLDGLRIVVDCANGASYRVAPEVLWELGAEVVPVGVEPNGFNINDGCGSTDTALAAAKVRETRADVGICLDGDADRVTILDEAGREADGDQIMAMIASRWAEEERLKGKTLVATVMSNLGLERFLAKRGVGLHRTKVGDRYVVEAMRTHGFNLGGEQSGHIIMTDHATTGDGLMAGLQFLAEMVVTGRKASELAQQFEPVPQLLKNVRYAAGIEPLETDKVRAAIADGEGRLNGGRLLIRKSGTEPLIRVMAEGEDERLLASIVDGIVAEVRAAAE
jgi:phosphoglucosamine mutase